MSFANSPAAELVSLVHDAIEPAVHDSFDDALTEHVQYVIDQWSQGLDHLNDVHLEYEEEDQEAFIEDLEDQARAALSDLVDEIDGIEIGYDFELTGLIYTSDIEEFYDDHSSECDDYFNEYKDMADSLDELKSYMVNAAKTDMAYEAMTDFREAINSLETNFSL